MIPNNLSDAFLDAIVQINDGDPLFADVWEEILENFASP